MNYSDYISFPKFYPVCDIIDEQDNYWTTFIPNDCFLSILDDVIRSCHSPNEHKSFWIQGTFGCGKSHAATVIKHLLCDDFDTIQGQAKRICETDERYARLNALRNCKRYIPVMLKGAEKAHSVHRASNFIKDGVKKSLEKYGVTHRLKTDFDEYIELLKDSRHRWDEILFTEGNDLKLYTDSLDSVIRELECGNISYLEMVEKSLDKANITTSSDAKSIVDWLRQAEKASKEEGFAGIIIFWDEITSLFEGSNLDLAVIELLQKIAELTSSSNSECSSEIYLYLISHKNWNDSNMKRTKDRFIIKEYKMELVTTYYILSHLIGKNVKSLDNEKYAFRHQNEVQSLLYDIEEDSHSNVSGKSFLEELFPLHPYTAYLCTDIARNFESANRSVFKFIYDSENGFNSFIQQEQIPKTCTSDYLWRFFETSFRENDQIYGDVISLYERHKNTLINNEIANSVFQVVLLLNALSKRSSGSVLATPSVNNICRAFAGVVSKDDVLNALREIQEKEIITCDASGYYVVENSALPREEIRKQEENLRRIYASCSKILQDPDYKIELGDLSSLVSDGIQRDKIIELHDATTPQNVSAFQNSIYRSPNLYKIKFIILPCLEGKVEETKRICQEEIDADIEDRNVVIIVPRECLSEKDYHEWIAYKAKQRVAEKRSLNTEADAAKKNAKLIIERWIENLRSSCFYLFLGKGETISATSALEIYDIVINQKLKPLFSYGAEQFSELLNRKNEWAIGNADKVVKSVLDASSRDEMFNGKNIPNKYSKLTEVLRAFDGVDIVGNDLKFTSNCPESSPLNAVKIVVDNIMEKKRKDAVVFNIADALLDLKCPPYGLYRNAISQFMLAFCLRDYKDKLYSAEGHLIGTIKLTEIVKALFCKWDGSAVDKNKATDIRFGSQEEKDFNANISELFQVDGSSNNTQSICRTAQAEFAKKVSAPLWIIKYLRIGDEKLISLYLQLIEFIEQNSNSNAGSTNPSNFEEMNEFIRSYRVDIKKLITEQNYALAFDTYIESLLPEFDPSVDSISQIKDYLCSKMPGEYHCWEESKTMIELLKYRSTNHQPEHPIIVTPPRVTPPPQPTSPSREVELLKKIEEIRFDVEKYIGFLTKLVQNHPEIHSDLLNFYNNESNRY